MTHRVGDQCDGDTQGILRDDAPCVGIRFTVQPAEQVVRRIENRDWRVLDNDMELGAVQCRVIPQRGRCVFNRVNRIPPATASSTIKRFQRAFPRRITRRSSLRPAWRPGKATGATVSVSVIVCLSIHRVPITR